MKRILLTEFLPEVGHANMFDNFYSLLSRNYKVRLMKARPYDNATDPAEITYYKPVFKSRHLSRVDYLFYSINNIKKVIKVANQENITTIVCVTYDEYALFLYSVFIPSWFKIFIMHNNNIDKFDRHSSSRLLFNVFKNRYNHIVLCGFMADYLKNKYGLSNVIVWPHPLNPVDNTSEDKTIDCLGISNSNDEEMIDSFIKEEKLSHVFKDNNLKVLLRSKKQTFDNGYLTVITGKLDKNDFDNLILHSKSILISFPSTYYMRMSGTLVDALSNNKFVFASKSPLIEESKKEYPNIIKYLDVKMLYKDLLDIKYDSRSMEEFERFKLFHSDNNLSDIMNKTLLSAIKGETIQNTFDF